MFALDEKIRVANHRIADLEDTIRWLWRTVIGTLATGAIGLLFAFIK
ncbi:hemolysin XhlA family protein [Clostridium butyricum]